MARPFRFHPPSPPDHSIARDRLLTLLEQRWDRRLVAISAGPGFGKTALLAAAVADERNRRGTDVWLTCEPADESSAHLAAGLAEALGVHGAAEIGAICDAVWSRAPEVVCLVLDDVHEIPAHSKGAQLLTTLLSDLPRNGRVVLASRAAPPVPTARLAAAGQLLRIDEEALSFDTDELLDFADQRERGDGAARVRRRVACACRADGVRRLRSGARLPLGGGARPPRSRASAVARQVRRSWWRR